MPINIIRRNNKYVSYIPVEKSTNTITNTIEKSVSIIYPIVFSKPITTKTLFYNRIGSLYIPIEINKELTGNVYFQVSIPNTSNWSNMKIKLECSLHKEGVATKIPLPVSEFLFTRFSDTSDFLKVPINISQYIVGTNNKLGLIITAKNIGDFNGTYNNIDLIYFEKTS